MKILIAEDEKTLREVLRDEFEHHHFLVETAQDGEEALMKAKAAQMDLILLDLMLPKKSGFEVLEALQADQVTKVVPVIILSNLGQDEDIKRALKLGATDYFVKAQHPIKEVVEKVKEILLHPPTATRA
ncbi:MAG: response regulator [Patescibacteria group bacterium]|jgi:DNA-binding response OmpR family regulator